MRDCLPAGVRHAAPAFAAVLATVLVAVLAAVLWLLPRAASCAPAGEADPGKPVDGGRIVLGTIGEPSNLNPYISTDASSHEVAGEILVAPLRYSKDLELEPWAAESWTVSPDGRRLEFTLRKGILWEDGVELTADDVVFTVQTAADPKVASPYAEDFLRIKSIRALDRYR
ncbi:MAG: peptide-binding protein, partial [Desulfovibrio sp.]|nr:peptide-binding protein [Desulfovibrio sp.]